MNHNRRFQQMRPFHIKTHTRALHIEQRSVSEWHITCSSPSQQMNQTYLNVLQTYSNRTVRTAERDRSCVCVCVCVYAGLKTKSQFASGKTSDRPAPSRLCVVFCQMLSRHASSTLRCTLLLQPSQHSSALTQSTLRSTSSLCCSPHNTVQR